MSLDTASATAKLRSLTQKFDERTRIATPFYPSICLETKSNGKDEEYAGLGSLPAVREWVGDRVFAQLLAHRFTIENKKWENSLGVEKDDIDDDRLGLYGPMLENLADEAMYHPDELVCDLVEAGDATPCFDGQSFFDTDHAQGESGTQNNKLTFNASDHTAVTAAEAKAAFHAAVTAMLGFKRDNGKTFIRPIVDSNDLKDLVVMVPLNLWEVFETGLTSTLSGGGNSNIVLRKARIVPVPRFSSTVKFWTFWTGGVLKPLIFQKRQPLQRQMKGLDDREFKDVKFMTDARYNVGTGAWWTGVQTTFN